MSFYRGKTKRFSSILGFERRHPVSIFWRYRNMASATNLPSNAKNYKALASYISTKELPWFEWFPGHYLKLCKLNPITRRERSLPLSGR
jgi:hypothetical protein